MTPSYDMFRFVDRLRGLKGAFSRLIKQGKITVNVDGKECKILGQIGMCHTAIDITDIDAKVGSKVVMQINPIHVQNSVRREYR